MKEKKIEIMTIETEADIKPESLTHTYQTPWSSEIAIFSFLIVPLSLGTQSESPICQNNVSGVRDNFYD